MSTPRSQSAPIYHELSLVFFTSLVISGAGLLSAHFALWSLGFSPWIPAVLPAAIGTGLLGVGLAVAFLHLGRPGRMANALRRIGRSPLSTEVMTAVVLLASATGAQLLPGHAHLTPTLWSLVALSSPGLLILLGRVYQLPGQLSWKGPTALSPLLLGLAIGTLVQAATLADNARLLLAGFTLLLVDSIGFAIRWLLMRWDSSFGEAVYPSLFRMHRRIMILRLVDVNLLPAILLLAQMPGTAAGILAIGILIDRFAFYALALRLTTEAEIERIEAVVRHRSNIKEFCSRKRRSRWDSERC
jgi:DMSO reductase anchor subunit